MKRNFLLLFFSFLIVFSVTTSATQFKSELWNAPNDLAEYIVTKVIDGDTIDVEKLGRIRYIGVDTPETKHPTKEIEPLGIEAYELNKKLVENKYVKIETDTQQKDKYGRSLAYVYVNKTFVNAYLIESGYAQILTIPPNIKYTNTFQTLQSEAREANRGLWAINITKNPKKDKEETKNITVYITRTGSKYHRYNCRYLAKSRIPINLKEAKSKGYSPCSVCGPPR